jgi:hypothetical protein
MERIEAAQHEVLIRGPEGEQKSWDEKGKLIRAGKARTEYVGYERYLTHLRVEAGDVDPDVEKLAQEIRRNDAFWGEMPAIVAQGDDANPA